jgi:hypothetical protein
MGLKRPRATCILQLAGLISSFEYRLAPVSILQLMHDHLAFTIVLIVDAALPKMGFLSLPGFRHLAAVVRRLGLSLLAGAYRITKLLRHGRQPCVPRFLAFVLCSCFGSSFRGMGICVMFRASLLCCIGHSFARSGRLCLAKTCLSNEVFCLLTHRNAFWSCHIIRLILHVFFLASQLKEFDPSVISEGGYYREDLPFDRPGKTPAGMTGLPSGSTFVS